MCKKVFQDKVKAKFPDKNIKFATNELCNTATIENIMFYNNVYSDFIYIQWNNIDCGRADF
jgi:uncharacterized protein YaaR (DUF327 family)